MHLEDSVLAMDLCSSLIKDKTMQLSINVPLSAKNEARVTKAKQAVANKVKRTRNATARLLYKACVKLNTNTPV